MLKHQFSLELLSIFYRVAHLNIGSITFGLDQYFLLLSIESIEHISIERLRDVLHAHTLISYRNRLHLIMYSLELNLTLWQSIIQESHNVALDLVKNGKIVIDHQEAVSILLSLVVDSKLNCSHLHCRPILTSLGTRNS